jgi:hypothetical protein
MSKFGARILKGLMGFGSRLLSKAQTAFNQKVQSGQYDLWQLINASPWKTSRGGAKALDWYRIHLRDNKDELIYKGLLEAGRLYTFRYLRPKHESTLDYFDTNPLVICLGYYKAKNGEIVEKGINLHLLPKDIRYSVISKIFSMYSDRYKGEMYRATQGQAIKLEWQNIALPLMQYGAAFAFRSYIPRLRTEVVQFKYEDWDKAIFLPSLKYKGTNLDKLVMEWKKYLLTKSYKSMTASQISKAVGGAYL